MMVNKLVKLDIRNIIADLENIIHSLKILVDEGPLDLDKIECEVGKCPLATTTEDNRFYCPHLPVGTCPFELIKFVLS